MPEPTLAPRHNDHGLVSDPFATPTLNPADMPTPPEPIAQIASRAQLQTSQEMSSRPSTLHGGFNNDQPNYPYKSESMSSNGTGFTMSPISSIYLEKSSSPARKSSHRKEQSASKDRHSKERRSRDPEKAIYSPSRGSYDRRPVTDRVAYLEDDELDESRELQERNAVKILLFLSGPVVVLSFLNAIWTLISVVITTLAQPVRLCARRPNFGQQLGGLLGPALNLQLKSIYTPLPPHADEDLSYRPGMLLVVQFLSPFHSLGIMLASWVIWIYWISSAVVGDPAGTDKRDDGRETALMLRDWWEGWLVKSMREIEFE